VGCLLGMFAAFFPRLFTLFLWIAKPVLFEAALGGPILAVLGILFLPLTTLMYVVLWTPAGLAGWDWVWVGLALVLDIGGVAASGFSNRDRLPSYTA